MAVWKLKSLFNNIFSEFMCGVSVYAKVMPQLVMTISDDFLEI